jgi:hypothetical protein
VKTNYTITWLLQSCNLLLCGNKSCHFQGRRRSHVLGGWGGGGGQGQHFPDKHNFFRHDNICNHIELNIDYSINLYWENVNWVRLPIFHLYTFYSNMFRTVKQRREVKFLLVYAGMLDHELDSDITNFPKVSTIGEGGGGAWPLGHGATEKSQCCRQMRYYTSSFFILLATALGGPCQQSLLQCITCYHDSRYLINCTSLKNPKRRRN